MTPDKARDDHTQETPTQAMNGQGWLSIQQAAKALAKSPKTVRRYIKKGDFGEGAVQTAEGPHGAQYFIRAEAVDNMKAALSKVDMVRVGDHAQGVESITTLDMQRVQGIVQSTVQGLVQGIADDAAEIRQATEGLSEQAAEIQRQTAGVNDRMDAVTNLLQAQGEALKQQSEEIGELRRELAEARRPWWQRIFRGKGDGGDG